MMKIPSIEIEWSTVITVVGFVLFVVIVSTVAIYATSAPDMTFADWLSHRFGGGSK